MEHEVFEPMNEGFTMAFGLEEYTTKEPKNDPTFVKWLAIYLVYDQGEIIEKRVEKLHPCDTKDFTKC